jgi:hypothetical protein
MLHYNTISGELLELLIKLQSVPEFSQLRLVGGTSLALQIGHRNSIDLDLFGKLHADDIAIHQQLAKLGNYVQLKKTENINIFSINGIKIDIVNYPYGWLEKPIVIDKITLADKKDIAAMKLAAITGRGSKKDFIDIFYLLKEYTLKQMLGFFEKKYPNGSSFLVVKSLSYFVDADKDEEPQMLQKIKWETIKKTIVEEVDKT